MNEACSTHGDMRILYKNLREKCSEGENLIEVAHDVFQRRAFVNTEMNFVVP
jgi:hypothetical protein